MGFEVIPSEEISHRADFSLLANARGYLDAVEIGVDQGVFAAEFLSRFRGHWLWGIDPYSEVPEYPFNRDGDLMAAVVALAPYHGRYRILRGKSPEAIPYVCEHISPSFVYVDGAHDEASVRADLEAWFEVPSVQMLAGHDFDPLHPGVVAAVERFARERDVTVRLTHETTSPPSFLIYKREPEVLYRRLFTGDEVPNPRAS